jgi:hypothetical protein
VKHIANRQMLIAKKKKVATKADENSTICTKFELNKP